MPNSGATTESYTVTGLSNGTTYKFRVRAVNDVGEGAASNEATATTPNKPGKPELRAIELNRLVWLEWTVPANNGSAITKFEYRRKTGGGSYGSWTRVPGSGATTSSHGFEDLTNGTTYTFRVRAVNAVGAGSESDAVSAIPRVPPPPPVPTGQSRTVEVLLSNASMTRVTCTVTNFNDAVVQEFTTGSNPGGYILSNFLLNSNRAETSVLATATLREKTSSGVPSDTVLATFTNPSSWVSGANTFTAPAGTLLAPDTSYFIQIVGSTNENRWCYGKTPTVDDGSSAGWSFGPAQFLDLLGTDPWVVFTPDLYYETAIRGIPLVQPDPIETFVLSGVDDGEIRLHWSMPRLNGNDYDMTLIRRQVNDGGWGPWEEWPYSEGHTVTGLTNGEAYGFQVAAQTNLYGAGIMGPPSKAVFASPSGSDCANYPGTRCRLGSNGGSATGVIEHAGDTNGGFLAPGSVGDIDWYRVNLDERYAYRFDLKGAVSGGGTLADPIILGIYAAGGNYFVPGTGNNNADANTKDSRVHFRPDTSGHHYIAVAGATGRPEQVGSYTLSSRRSGIPTTPAEVDTDAADCPADETTTCAAVVGGEVTGSLRNASDVDWISFEAKAGAYYHIYVRSGGLFGTLPDPLMHIHNSAGTRRLQSSGTTLETLDYSDNHEIPAWQSNISGGNGTSLAVINAQYTGKYYISVESGSGKGTYTVDLRASPDPITDLRATPGDGSATLRWTMPSGNGNPVDAVRYRRVGYAGWITIPESGEGGANATSYNMAGHDSVIGGMETGKTYHYEVQAINTEYDRGGGFGTGTFSLPISNIASVTASARIIRQQALLLPGAPVIASATAQSHTRIDVLWSTTDPVSTRYQVQWSSDGVTWHAVDPPNKGGGTVYSHIGLTPGTTYDYRVRGVNDDGHGAWSPPVAATTLATDPHAPQEAQAAEAVASPPDLVDDFRIWPGDGKALLRWTVPEGNDAPVIRFEYNLIFESDTDDPYVAPYRPVKTWQPGDGEAGSSVSYISSPLSNGYLYQMEMKAISSVGWSAASDKVGFTPGPVQNILEDSRQAGHGNLQAIWSDGVTVWVSDDSRDTDDLTMYAYMLEFGASDPAGNWTRAAANTRPTAMWGNDETVWVADASGAIHSYNRSDYGDAGKDLALSAAATGLWGDDNTLWVNTAAGGDVQAYSISDLTADSDRDIELDGDNADPTGMWGNGETLWVADGADQKLYAYSLDGETRNSCQDITLYADNAAPRDVWGDGTTLWVTDDDNPRTYAYDIRTASAHDVVAITGTGSGQDSIQLQWSRSDDTCAQRLGMEYRIKTGDGRYGRSKSIPGSGPGSANANSYTLEGLSGSVEYTIQVSAWNLVRAGNTVVFGPWSPAVSVTTLGAGAEPQAINAIATGAPTISGTAQVGETLTADTSGIADEDGLDNAVFSYQWQADDADIAGASGSTYTLADADEGKTVTVSVSFADDAGNAEALTSDATDAVEGKLNTPATGAPTISGTALVGETLTADTSGIADEDRLDNASFTYQWQADGSDISGATGDTYTLADSEEGQTVSVTVSFTDDAGNDESLTSAATAAVGAKPNTPATGQPTISGTAQVGETLTADTSGISDSDGLSNAAFTYQWLADGADISGAIGSTGRANRRQLHLSVAGRRRGHLRGNERDVHPGRRRRGHDHQCNGELHRRRRQRRIADQRGHGCGGGRAVHTADGRNRECRVVP